MLGYCVGESIGVEYELVTEVMNEGVEEQTGIGGAECLRDLEKGHGDGERVCVGCYGVM